MCNDDNMSGMKSNQKQHVDKHVCQCGCEIYNSTLHRHVNTEKHKPLWEQNQYQNQKQQ